jgi:hypothetical protein
MAHPSQVVAFGACEEALVLNYSAGHGASACTPMKIMRYEVHSTKVVVLHSDVNRAAVAADLNR